MQRPAISVVIPAYMEEDGIADTVTRVRGSLEGRGASFEILVVDNASEDRTAERVLEVADGERVRLLRNDRNRGKGFSVRRGMLEATGEVRLHCDADCAPSLASLPEMLALLDRVDVVSGSRLAAGARVGQRQTLPRRAVGHAFVYLCRVALREPTRDLFCGFKLWRAEAAETTFARTVLDGWTFDAEALAMARALGFRLHELGIAWEHRMESRLAMGRVLVPVVGELLQARRHIRREARAYSAAPDPLVPEPADRGS